MNIVLTGGGSAGHVTPNIALLPYLKKQFKTISYIGSKDGIEKQLIEKQKIPYYSITTCKLVRSFNLKNFLLPLKLLKGIVEAKKILKKLKPNIIFSKGGFVSVPVVIAAHQLKIPIIAHESDYSLGLANKIIYNFCNIMCFTFNNVPSKYKSKSIVTGSPIRQDIISKNKINFKNNKKTILIMGGSLGAKAINELIFNNIDQLLNKYNIIHIVGKNNLNNELKTKNNYIQFEYTNNIGELFNSCNIVISRAGSNTIFELLALNKPMILIPLPKTSSRGDQIENAKYFKINNYANVIYQENLTINILLNTIEKTLNSNYNKQLTQNPFKANNDISEIIKNYSNNKY